MTLCFKGKKCGHCYGSLRGRTVHNYKDFENRVYHVKCYKELVDLEIINECYNLKRKKSFNNIMDNYKINFGKHKDKTFKELVETDEKYCLWLLKLEDFKNEKLKQYIKDKLKV